MKLDVPDSDFGHPHGQKNATLVVGTDGTIINAYYEGDTWWVNLPDIKHQIDQVPVGLFWPYERP